MNDPRIPPLEPPYAPDVAALLDGMMPRGAPIPPLALFRTLAVNPPLAQAMHATGAHVLAKKKDPSLALPSRVRELVILRTTARCGCAYEWSVHATVFAAKVGITDAQRDATARGAPDDPCFSRFDAGVLEAVDELYDFGRVSDATWARCAERLAPAQMLELLFVCGWYHAIAFVANGARVAAEPWAIPFPA